MGMEILVGPIASGKSTYARKAAKEGKIIINDDAIVKMLHGGDYLLYRKSLKSLYKIIETTIIQFALAHNRTVVIDRPNHKRDTRMRYIKIAKAFDKPTTLVVFPREAPKVHALRRFHSDSRGLTARQWMNIAVSHDVLFEEADQDVEGFDRIIKIRIHKGEPTCN